MTFYFSNKPKGGKPDNIALLSCGVVYYAVQGGEIVSRKMWPFI